MPSKKSKKANKRPKLPLDSNQGTKRNPLSGHESSLSSDVSNESKGDSSRSESDGASPDTKSPRPETPKSGQSGYAVSERGASLPGTPSSEEHDGDVPHALPNPKPKKQIARQPTFQADTVSFNMKKEGQLEKYRKDPPREPRKGSGSSFERSSSDNSSGDETVIADKSHKTSHKTTARPLPAPRQPTGDTSHISRQPSFKDTHAIPSQIPTPLKRTMPTQHEANSEVEQGENTLEEPSSEAFPYTLDEIKALQEGNKALQEANKALRITVDMQEGLLAQGREREKEMDAELNRANKTINKCGTDHVTTISQQLEKIAHLQEEIDKQKQTHDSEITDLKQKLQHVTAQLSMEANGENPLERPYWEKAHKELKAAHLKLQERYTRLLKVTVQYKGPEMERQIIELKERLTKLTDRYNLVVEELNQWKEKAAQWQDEHHIVEERYRQSIAESKDNIERLEQEMRNYIKEYHDNLPKKNPEYWNVESLQKRIGRYESELDKRARENEKMREEHDKAIKEFRKVYDAMEAGKFVHYKTASGDSKIERRPKYDFEPEIERRKSYIRALEEKQKKVRADQTSVEQLIEKARKYKMDLQYPPDQPGYEKLVRTGASARWECKKFFNSPDCREKDREEAVRLKLV